MQAEAAARDASSQQRDAIKLSEASEALKQASQCLRAATEALQWLRTTRTHLEVCQNEAAATATTVSECRAALDAAKLAVVVAEGEADALQPSGASFTPPVHAVLPMLLIPQQFLAGLLAFRYEAYAA